MSPGVILPPDALQISKTIRRDGGTLPCRSPDRYPGEMPICSANALLLPECLSMYRRSFSIQGAVAVVRFLSVTTSFSKVALLLFVSRFRIIAEAIII